MKDLVKSVLKVFDGKQKRKLVGMMFLILINSGVSLLGVSVLSPFITAVMNPEELLKNDIIRSVYDGFHMQNTNQLITPPGADHYRVYCKKCVYHFYQ